MKRLSSTIKLSLLGIFICFFGQSTVLAGGSAYFEWLSSYTGNANIGANIGMAVCMGPDGRIFATGQVAATSAGYSNMPVVAFHPDGTIDWAYEYHSGGFDMAYTIISDDDGNIYVGGEGSGHFTVFSVDPQGNFRWDFQSPASGGMAAFDLVIAPDGHLYAGGSLEGGAIISLTTDGAERWTFDYVAPGGGWSNVTAIDVDEQSNIYASGSADYKFLVFSVDSEGNFRWEEIHQGTATGAWIDNMANDIVVANDGNIYSTGKFDMAGQDGRVFITMSFDSDGNMRWEDIHAGTYPAADVAWAITSGPDNSIYVGGKGVEAEMMDVWVVIKYNYDGDKLWTIFENPIYGINGLNSITTDEEGNVFATGWTAAPKFGVLGLNSEGETLFTHVVDPTAASGSGNGIVTGNDGMVYAVGFSMSELMTPGELQLIAFSNTPKPSEIAVTPDHFSETLPQGHSSQHELLIFNQGGLDLIYDINIDYTFKNAGNNKNGWIGLSSTEGQIPANEHDVVIITLDAEDLSPGNIHANLVIYSNDENNSPLIVPVSLTVLQTFSLILHVNPAEGGQTSGAGQYLAGEQVSISATPNSGYEFINWENEDSSEFADTPDFQFSMPAAEVVLTANFELGTGIPILITEGITVYPNPAGRNLNIEGDTPLISIHILDLPGKVINRFDANGQNTITIDISDLAPGLYLVRVLLEDGVITERIRVY
ncbi:MAG: T9SS C-terminal target domain-containing protein [Bacteroidia bacterium]|nr:MAG: T9SS C-terminal target domain-containing protein [Bacteroidia bacterium]